MGRQEITMTRPAATSRSTRLIDVVFAELDDDALDHLARMLARRLSRFVAAAATATGDGWLDTKRAAEYLGISQQSLHKHTAARSIPFVQDGPGCKCWFKRSELDAWRRGDKNAAEALPRSGYARLPAANELTKPLLIAANISRWARLGRTRDLSRVKSTEAAARCRRLLRVPVFMGALVA
jgi:excisionase family DNA binding protein